jgi:hypothetical protein
LFLLETPKKKCEIRVEIENEFLFVFIVLQKFYLGRRDEISGWGGGARRTGMGALARTGPMPVGSF